MQQTWWESEQIIAATIVGTCTLTAALLSVFMNARRQRVASQKRRRRPRGKLRLAGGVTLAVLFAAGAIYRVIGPPPAIPVTLAGPLAALKSFLPGAVASSDPSDAGEAALTAERVGAAAPSADLADWLRSDRTVILFRYADYLPTACEAGAQARGSWNDGWYLGTPVRCLDDAWLAFDVAPLVADGRIARNVTYCLNFRDRAGRWAQHGTRDAPGLAQIAVQAGTSGADAYRNIGFRVVREAREDRVVFGNVAPRAPC